MSSDIDVKINDKPVADFLRREFPRFLNAGLNEGYKRSASGFARKFTDAKLANKESSVFRVKRPHNVKKRRGQPSVPKAFVLAGFHVSLKNPQDLDRKILSIRTSSPLLLIREYGGTIPDLSKKPRKGGRKPFKGKYLAIPMLQGGRGRNARKVSLRLVEEVRIKPVLEFVASWRRYQPKIRELIDRSLDRAIKRAQAKMDRDAARREGQAA